jgi:hypothetical protein
MDLILPCGLKAVLGALFVGFAWRRLTILPLTDMLYWMSDRLTSIEVLTKEIILGEDISQAQSDWVMRLSLEQMANSALLLKLDLSWQNIISIRQNPLLCIARVELAQQTRM